MNIITNNHPRDLIDGADLTEKERKELDYIPEGEWFEESYARFFRYKGNVYDTQDCEPISLRESFRNFRDWHGMYTETYFSGILFKYADDEFETVIVGRYYA